MLPETEGRTLEEIELHFADNSKTICDRKIAKIPRKSTNGTGNAGKTSREISAGVEMKYGTMSTENDNKAFQCDDDLVGQRL